MSNDTNAANQPSYEVGYAKPPRQHRFEKGRSGNPGGRPKGSARAKRTEKLDPSHQPTNRMLLDEAYRPITVREGDQVIELPAIQAVFRAMGVAAMKGNRFAQKTLAELVQKVEDENRATRSDYIQTMIDYKYDGDKYLKHHRDNNLPEPEMLPHPDDIIIDLERPWAYVAGPNTRQDKDRWERLLARRDEAQHGVTNFAETYRKATSEEETAGLLDGFARQLTRQLEEQAARRRQT